MTSPATSRHRRTDPRINLVPPSISMHVWLFVLVVLLPLALTAIAFWFDMAGKSAQLIADKFPSPALSSLATVALVTVALWLALDRATRRHRLTLDGDVLQIATTFYTRQVAIADLALGRARVVDLAERTDLKPMIMTNAIRLPGLRSGWFRLRNRDKALLATMGGTRLLWIPTHGDYGLLLQPRQPQALLDALREMAAPSVRR